MVKTQSGITTVIFVVEKSTILLLKKSIEPQHRVEYTVINRVIGLKK